MLADNGDYCRTDGSIGFSYNCFSKEKLSGELLEASFVDFPIDDLLLHSMPSPSISDPEQPHELQLKHKNQCICQQELNTTRVDQQELCLLPDMLTKNIFNSQPSMLVYSYIPQISSIQSFIGKNTSSLANDAAPERNSLFVDSTTGISSDQSLQDLSSYELNSVEAIPSTEYTSVNLDLVSSMGASTNSLEAAVKSRRRLFQLKKQNIIEGRLNFSDGTNVSKLTFLNHSWVPLVRGRTFGGSNCRPPKKPLLPGTRYAAAHLRLEYSSYEDMCLPEWNEYELKDNRRIIRIERRYDSNEIVASFSIVGSAVENQETRPVSNPDVKVLEVSCLKCLINDNESEEEHFVDENAADEEHHCVTEPQKPSFERDLNGRTHKISRISTGCKYYITSVEVIKIIELLVGSSSISDPQQRRKERGRVRSNLAQFWSKYLVSSSKKNMRRLSLPACNDEYLAELAHRINTYEIRKPRIFDKSIKILEWPRLGPALQRAFQSYYMVQLDESYNQIVLTNND
ncbi:BA75_00004T0 [Komagataella pastoris]|uniref:BA75_00004T0 n=1 Tax=Komagataella pastoris TaxID=4922 RepID=A0A1B2J6H6_PICPA|nr:BA75_00004T0 [Komagataella pastoris]